MAKRNRKPKASLADGAKKSLGQEGTQLEPNVEAPAVPDPLSTPPQQQPSTSKGKTIELTEESFQGLLSTIEKLNQRLGDMETGEAEIEIPSVQTRKANVHFYKGQAIIKLGRAWEEPSKIPGELNMRLEIYTDDDKLHVVSHKAYREDLEAEGFTVKKLPVKEIKTIDEGVDVVGRVEKVQVEYDKFRSVAKGMVPMKVVTPKYLYVMDHDGEEIVLDPLALN